MTTVKNNTVKRKPVNHTPGPWEIEPCLDGSLFVKAGDRYVNVQTEDDERLTDEDWANSYLMAAAPAMLKSLKRIKELLDDYFQSKDELIPAPIVQAYELIEETIEEATYYK